MKPDYLRFAITLDIRRTKPLPWLGLELHTWRTRVTAWREEDEKYLELEFQ